jgi:hypothetical protein
VEIRHFCKYLNFSPKAGSELAEMLEDAEEEKRYESLGRKENDYRTWLGWTGLLFLARCFPFALMSTLMGS